MLYLGIDQHSKQLTVCVREESGQIVQRKQVAGGPDVALDVWVYKRLLPQNDEAQPLVNPDAQSSVWATLSPWLTPAA